MVVKTRKIKPNDANWIKSVFDRRWGGDFIVSRGKIHRPEGLDGYVAEVGNRKKGLATFKIINKEMEIVSLDSFLKGKGIGTKLVKATTNLAKKRKLKRVWLITTNDNVGALIFWQKTGFALKAVYSNAIKVSRKLKPGIPAVGNFGIPIRDEIELEFKIKNNQNLARSMKNYSSNRAQKGKTAYRTPSRFIYKMALKSTKIKHRAKKT